MLREQRDVFLRRWEVIDVCQFVAQILHAFLQSLGLFITFRTLKFLLRLLEHANDFALLCELYLLVLRFKQLGLLLLLRLFLELH